MAEESVNLPTTPEKTKSDEGNSRRNSMGNPISSNNEGKILPHYLRASTGSCHDFCKYGKHHAIEAKARRPIRKRIITPPSDGQNPVETEVLAERKKTVAVKLKPSSNSQSPLPDSSKIIKQEVSSPSKKVEVRLKQASSNAKEKNLSAKLATPLKPKPVTVKSVSSPNPSAGSSGRLATSLKPKPETVKPMSSPNPSGGSSGRRYRDAKNGKESNSSAKHATSLKPKPVTVKPSSSPNPEAGSSGRRNGDAKMGKKTGTFKVAVKKVLAPPTASLSPKPSLSGVASLNTRRYRSLKIVSPLKNQNRIKKAELEQQIYNDNVPEKTLYVIKMETENKTLVSAENGSPTIRSSLSSSSPSPKFSSHPNSPSLSSYEEDDQEESEYTVSDADNSILEYNETVNMNEAETLEGECKRRPRNTGMIYSEDKECSPVKLNFSRGRVVDLQSENNGPRRLRFRRGRGLGENPNVRVEARRRIFKRREVDGDTNGTDPNSEKVVLRHQDVQGKKDAQGLFNNVIEETASKLVETRKSKVKALVGAFETVISLQESKPSANNAS